MNEQEFETLFAESLLKLDAYIATQITERQIFSARGHRHTVEMNKSHYKYLIDKGEPVTLCKHCGAISTANYVEPTRAEILEHGLCFRCNYWRKLVDTKDAKRLIIDGHIYGDGGNRPNEPKRHLLGFGGTIWTIERDGKTWQTNNLWSGSTIPQEYRERMPDNARFVKGGTQ